MCFQVDMMTKTFYSILRYSPPVKYRQTSKYEAVHLPYKGGTTSAVIVLPDADSAKYGVAAAAAKLDIGELLDLDRYMPVYYWDLIVELPKFKVKTESVSFLEVRRLCTYSRSPRFQSLTIYNNLGHLQYNRESDLTGRFPGLT